MPEYARRPIVVKVHEYVGEDFEDLPEWIKDYQAYNNLLGMISPRCVSGDLLIPTANNSIQVKIGMWVVQEPIGAISVYTPEDFNLLFVAE